ncbi:indole-3-glycerol phosphate synthase TrpC [Persicitalea jodogahamensis]|uniref:Indole-3-glycerol phosphate synthase n=1 Tax=Persicitalea jodogahamensis TaxID=402147 RepID=A0A8J3GCH2_9BACT|nr:indole-3-glycerol phosphate synthase TrpC [Persicitalea jodogahamensis]GHB89105.1 indole-3-glycerol phosphate synthase [Persicitalea jodogahamensis]
MNILDKIVAQKRIEVAAAKTAKPQSTLERDPLFSRQTLSLADALRQADAPGIISEFKRQSPSKGVINGNVEPEVVTAGYSAAGAKGLSVLTDTLFFGGSFSDFEKARAANPSTPMLRKDFMIDEYQLFEARALGADVILLIAACLSSQEVRTLAQKAHELDLEVLLEVHDAEELTQSLCDEVDMVGVNNRNLKTFSTSVDTSAELAAQIPDRFVKISESGLKDAETIVQLFEQGYRGFLIGETFMKTPDPAAALESLQKDLFRIIEQKHLII